MSPEKSAELRAIYPKIFSDIPNPTLFTMFGFECGDGWFPLLRELIYDIMAVCKRDCLDIRVNRVKEKYGTLRFYMSRITDDIDELIEAAVERSKETCEVCGDCGVLRCTNNWLEVRCDDCAK